MIFTKLRLNNFKSYNKETIKFNKGISVIIGENGAGKSTILEAISFALFKQHTAKKIGDLVRNNQTSMSVDLEFIANGKKYRVVREKTKSGIKSRFYKKTSSGGDFVPICTGDREVANEISSILDIDSNLFLNAIYIRQGEISELVDKSPAEKKKLIGRLLGIDSLETAWKNLAPIISDYERDLAELKGQLASDDDLKKEYEVKKLELDDLKQRGHELEEQISEVTKLIDDLSEDKRNMEREKEIYEAQVNGLNSEKTVLEKLENDKKRVQNDLDEVHNAEEQITRLEKYVSKLDVYLDFEKSVVSIQRLKEDENEIEEKLASIDNQKIIVESKKEGYNNFLKCDEEISKLNTQKINLEKELANITQLEKDKKELLKSIEEDRNEIEDFFSRAKDNLQNNGLSQDILAEVSELNKLEEVNNDFIDETSTKIKDLTSDIATKKEDIVAFKQAIKACEKPLEELKHVDNKCPVCQSDIDTYKKNELIEQYNGDIDSNRQAIEEHEETIRLLSKNKDSFEQKVEKLQDLSKNIIEYKHKFASLEKDLVQLKKIDEGLDAKEYTGDKLGELILEIAKKKENREAFKEDYDSYNQAKGALDVLGSETEAQYKLNQINNEIDVHVKNIKLAIDQDPHLSGDMDTAELEKRINDLKEKNEQYNQLKGFVQNRNSLTAQLDSIKEDIGVSINQIEIFNNKINASSYDKEKFEQIIYRYEVYERRSISFNNELSEIKGRAKELIVNVKNLTDKILNNDKIKKQYKDTSEYIKLLSTIRDLYGKNGIQKDLRLNSKPIIQKHTKKFFDEFNFNYSNLILSDDYDILVSGPEGDSSISMVSGGEKIAIALALRLGITQAISEGELNTILLDEPTIHLDSARRHELINLLKEIKVLPQMIIVTHEPQLENAAENVIKVEKENGISKIVS